MTWPLLAAAAQLADWALSRWALASVPGSAEANPLMADPLASLALKGAGVAAVLWAARLQPTRRRSRLLLALCAAAGAAGAASAALAGLAP